MPVHEPSGISASATLQGWCIRYTTSTIGRHSAASACRSTDPRSPLLSLQDSRDPRIGPVTVPRPVDRVDRPRPRSPGPAGGFDHDVDQCEPDPREPDGIRRRPIRRSMRHRRRPMARDGATAQNRPSDPFSATSHRTRRRAPVDGGAGRRAAEAPRTRNARGRPGFDEPDARPRVVLRGADGSIDPTPKSAGFRPDPGSVTSAMRTTTELHRRNSSSGRSPIPCDSDRRASRESRSTISRILVDRPHPYLA